MKKKIEKKDNRSLKTFFLYTFAVFFVILISLSIKAFFILRQSKFDGNHFNLAVSQNNRVVAILGFNPNKNSISLLKMKNSKMSVSSLGQNLGILVDGKISSKSDLSNESTESIFEKTAFRNNSIKTDLTIFDVARLFLFTKNVRDKDRQIEEIRQAMSEHDSDKIISDLFKDAEISRENITIEIINATSELGLGKRLERCLNNAGANVVSVSTPRVSETVSRIQYVGAQTYTVEKLKKVLKFPTEKINKKTIAKIVIIIGENGKNPTSF